MAAKAEILKVRIDSPTPRHRPQIARAVRAWFRKGQLGASSYTELGRHTGARV